MTAALLWFGALLCGVGLVAAFAAASRRQAISAMYLLAEVAGIGFLVLSAWLSAGAARAERLERLNAEAAADSTHHFLRGQLQVALRLAIQKPLPARAVAAVTITAPAITAARVDTVHVVDSTSTIGQLDTLGVQVGARVVFTPPTATWYWSLRHEPVTYRVTFQGCHDHAASVSVEGPKWQSVQLTEVQQAPGICNPPPRWSPFSFRPPSLLWIGGIAVLTYVVVH